MLHFLKQLPTNMGTSEQWWKVQWYIYTKWKELFWRRKTSQNSRSDGHILKLWFNFFTTLQICELHLRWCIVFLKAWNLDLNSSFEASTSAACFATFKGMDLAIKVGKSLFITFVKLRDCVQTNQANRVSFITNNQERFLIN